MSKPVPVDGKRLDWPRLVANAINELQTVKVGTVRFEGGVLQWWDGETWQNVP